jgi:hypothetical protein
MRWERPVAHMGGNKNTYKVVLVGNPEGKRSL